MTDSLFSATIAFFGVLISVLLSFLSSKRLFRAEQEKLELSIEQNYATKLVEKRLEFYPLIYECLSNVSKLTSRIINGDTRDKLLYKDIEEFQKVYDDLNSKYAVVFSSLSSQNSRNMRMYLSKLLTNNPETDMRNELSLEDLRQLKDKIVVLEFSLKQDLGIYIVELKDPKRLLQLEKYDDVLEHKQRFTHDNL